MKTTNPKLTAAEIAHIESRALAVDEITDWQTDGELTPANPDYHAVLFFSAARSHVLRLITHSREQQREIEALQARIEALETDKIKGML